MSSSFVTVIMYPQPISRRATSFSGFRHSSEKMAAPQARISSETRPRNVPTVGSAPSIATQLRDMRTGQVEDESDETRDGRQGYRERSARKTSTTPLRLPRLPWVLAKNIFVRPPDRDFQRYGERYGISPTLFLFLTQAVNIRGSPPSSLLCPLLLSKHAYGSRVPWRGHTTTKKPKRSKKTLKSSRRTKVTAKAAKETKAATQSAPPVKSSPTYTESFSLRWDQIDLDHNLIFFGGKTKTEGSSEPAPLTGIARDVLLRWKKEQGGKSPFLFPSPVKPDQPITTVKTAWTTTLKNSGVAHFPIYHLRHVFCTRLSWVAPDAIVQRAMRHSSPETKRHYQLGMLEQVRQNLEKANEKVYGKGEVLRFHDGQPAAENEQGMTAHK